MTRRAATVLLVVLLVLHAGWSLLYVWRTSFVADGERVFVLWDDAMISMQYAKNLAAGHGLVWNAGGERVQGITNLGLTLVMAALHLLPVGPRHLSLVLQLASVGLLGLSVVLTARLARTLAGGELGAGLAAALLAALYAPLAIWTLQGSDVGAVAVALLVAAAAVARSAAAGRSVPWSAHAALAAAVLVRPDASLAWLVLLALLPLLDPRWHTRLPAAAFCLGVLWAGLLAFGWLYYGDPLPNTWYLKGTGSPRALVWESGWRQTALFFGGRFLPFLVATLLLFALVLRRERAPLFPAGVALAFAAYNFHVGGDWLWGYGSRYVVPIVPLLLALFVAGASRWLTPRLAPRRPASALAVLALLTVPAANPPVPLHEWLVPGADTMLRSFNFANYKEAVWLREHSDPDTTVGVYWAGIPIYFSGRPGVDVLGKSDRHIARLRVDGFDPGHSKTDWDYVVEARRPDVILGDGRGLARNPAFRAAYERATSGLMIDLRVRRDAVRKLHDPALHVEPLAGAPARQPGA